MGRQGVDGKPRALPRSSRQTRLCERLVSSQPFLVRELRSDSRCDRALHQGQAEM